MAQYHFSKQGRYGRRIEIRKGSFRISVVALVVSFLLACLIWLYMDGQELRQIEAENHGTPSSEGAVAMIPAVEILEDVSL